MFRIQNKTKRMKIVYVEERKDGDFKPTYKIKVSQQSVSGMVIRKSNSFVADMH